MSDTSASSTITAHAFYADRWWERCAICGFSMAAHERMTERVRLERATQLGAHDHRCPDCVQLGTDCTHRWED